MKLIIILSFFILLFATACSHKSPDAVLEEFYNYHEPDSESLDPLILAGEKVVPLIIEKIQDKYMNRRRLAIDFLGNGEYKQALPVLQKIMQDENEEQHFRQTCLISIFQIDKTVGTEFAQYYKNDIVLGEISKDILSNKEYLHYRRTYIDALLRRHD